MIFWRDSCSRTEWKGKECIAHTKISASNYSKFLWKYIGSFLFGVTCKDLCHSVIYWIPQCWSNFTFRQSGGGGVDLIQPVLPIKNVTFSTMTVAGVEWVCEQLSETQCKPLYPQVNLSRTFRPFYLIHIPYLKNWDRL